MVLVQYNLSVGVEVEVREGGRLGVDLVWVGGMRSYLLS